MLFAGGLKLYSTRANCGACGMERARAVLSVDTRILAMIVCLRRKFTFTLTTQEAGAFGWTELGLETGFCMIAAVLRG
jgi:hypothetical protein